MYTPDQWHDFLVMVGGAAAALTGLVFVAMSLNLETIARDATHRHRAIGTLTGFTAAFVICAPVLMGGQNYRAAGIEWLVISIIAAAIYVYGYVRAIRIGRSSLGLRPHRLVVGTSLYLAEIIGAILLMLGNRAGVYVAAAVLIGLLTFTITGAWLLLLGVHLEATEKQSHER
jgi:hypothetical protein